MTDAGAAPAHIRAASSVSCSPANRLQRRSGIAPGRSCRSRRAREITDGTENQCVISLLFTNLTGAILSSGRATTTRAPADQATNMSNTDGSNVSSNVCDSRDSGVTP